MDFILALNYLFLTAYQIFNELDERKNLLHRFFLTIRQNQNIYELNQCILSIILTPVIAIAMCMVFLRKPSIDIEKRKVMEKSKDSDTFKGQFRYCKAL